MTAFDLLQIPLLAVLAIAWLVAVVSAYQLVTKHRPEGRTVSDYFQGTAWFGPDAFAPSGAAVRRRMHLALAVFFGLAFVVAGVVVVAEVL